MKSIFLIEDDPDIQEMLVMFLESEGYTASAANNGQAALDYLRTAPELPGLIFLDLQLPIMDGKTFRKEQVLDPRLSEIPVVIMSAGGKLEIQSEQLKPLEFLGKPIDLDDLISKVQKYIH